MPNLPDIQTRLTLEERQFNTALRRASGRVTGFAKTATKAFAGVGLAVTGAAGGFLALAKQAAESADATIKASRNAGLSAESYQELEFALGQTGLSTQQVNASFNALNKRLGEFQNTGAGAAKQVFEDLSLSTESSEAAFNDFVKKLEAIEEPAKRSALASKLLGDEVGKKFGSALSIGSDGLSELRQKARDFGLVIETDLLENAEAMNDQFELLEKTIGQNFKRAILESAEPLTNFTNQLLANKDVIFEMAAGLGAAIVKFSEFTGLIKKTDSTKLADLNEEIELFQTLIRKGEEGEGRGFFASLTNTPVENQAIDNLEKNKERLKALLAERGVLEQKIDSKKVSTDVKSPSKPAVSDEQVKKNSDGDLASGAPNPEKKAFIANEKAKLDYLKENEARMRELRKQSFDREQELIASQMELADELNANRQEMLDEIAAKNKEVNDTIATSIADLVLAGKSGFKDLVDDMIKQFARQQLQAGLSKIFGGAEGGGGLGATGFGSFLGSFLGGSKTPAFAEGGSTGPRRGPGIDGKGGFNAVLHPNEIVLNQDQQKALSSGGNPGQNISNSVNVTVNANGGSGDDIAAKTGLEIEKQMNALVKKQIANSNRPGGVANTNRIGAQ